MKSRDFLCNLPGEFSVFKCRKCGFCFQNPRPVTEELSRLYPETYAPHRSDDNANDQISFSPVFRDYLKRKKGYSHLSNKSRLGWKSSPLFDFYRRWKAAVRLIPDYVPNGTLLEIGCGSGARLSELHLLGWTDLVGIEPVAAAARNARRLGFSIIETTAEAALPSLETGRFDSVIMSMVLEHLFDPFGMIRQIHRILKPGGQFLFSTIAADSLDAVLFGPYAVYVDLPRHFSHFTSWDLRTMLKVGFRVEGLFRQPGLFDFIRAVERKKAAQCATFLDRIVIRLAKSRFGPLLDQLNLFLPLSSRVSVISRRNTT